MGKAWGRLGEKFIGNCDLMCSRVACLLTYFKLVPIQVM